MRKTAAWLVFAASVAGFATPAAADCRCRAVGVVVNEGQTACIATPDGRKLARCEKSQNVSSWRFLEDTCPSAGGPMPLDPAPETLALSR
jgi:hypothetical protein